jgi:uncharacterized membrane protein YkvA (DUF1232 family)
MSDATIRISFEIGEKDIRYFRARLGAVRRSGSARAEERVIAGAARLVKEALEAGPPEFVHERIAKLELLIAMLRDRDWRLEGRDRERILEALAYFVDPDDLIPDRVPVIGYLDDAIMIELVVRELAHEIEAYQDFCSFRQAQHPQPGDPELESRRQSLQARMRRRRHRERARARATSRGSRRSPLGLW